MTPPEELIRNALALYADEEKALGVLSQSKNGTVLSVSRLRLSRFAWYVLPRFELHPAHEPTRFPRS